MDRFTPRSTPKPLETLLAEAPSEKTREQLQLAFSGSAMDLIGGVALIALDAPRLPLPRQNQNSLEAPSHSQAE